MLLRLQYIMLLQGRNQCFISILRFISNEIDGKNARIKFIINEIYVEKEEILCIIKDALFLGNYYCMIVRFLRHYAHANFVNFLEIGITRMSMIYKDELMTSLLTLSFI